MTNHEKLINLNYIIYQNVISCMRRQLKKVGYSVFRFYRYNMKEPKYYLRRLPKRIKKGKQSSVVTKDINDKIIAFPTRIVDDL